MNVNFLTEKLHNSKVVLLILGFVLMLFYGNVLQNGYSLDDQYIYTENSLTNNGLQDVSAIFQSASFEYNGKKRFGYRPITILTFAVENQIFGINSTVSHIINLLLYLWLCYLLYLIFKRLFPELPVYLAFLVALLFLILPIHSEIVNNVKCRDELLFLLFGFLAVWCWLQDKKRWMYRTCAILLVLLSVFSKKTGLVFIGIIPLMVFFKTKGNWKKSLFSFLIMALPFLLRRVIFKKVKVDKISRLYQTMENPLYGDNIPHEKITIVAESAWFYVKSLFFPTDFSAYYGYKTIEVLDFRFITILGFLFLIFMLGFSLYKLKKARPVTLGAILILLGIIPFINVVLPITGIIAERFATLASIGWSLFVIYGIHQLIGIYQVKWLKPIIVLSAVAFIIASWSVVFAHNPNWKSENAIMEHSLSVYPKNVVFSKSLATNYNRLVKVEKNPQTRKKLLQKMLGLNKVVDHQITSFSTVMNIASLELTVNGNAAKAEKYYKKALGIKSNSELAWVGLNRIYQQQNLPQKQIKALRKLIDLQPKKQPYYSALYQLVKSHGTIDDIALWNETVKRVFPDNTLYLLSSEKRD